MGIRIHTIAAKKISRIAEKYNASYDVFYFKYNLLNPDDFKFINVHYISWDTIITEDDYHRGWALRDRNTKLLKQIKPCDKNYLTLKIEFDPDLPEDLLKEKFIEIVREQCRMVGKPPSKQLPANKIRQVKACNFYIQQKKTYLEVGIEFAPPNMRSRKQKEQWARDAVRAGYEFLARRKFKQEDIDKLRENAAAAESNPCVLCNKRDKRGQCHISGECPRLSHFLHALDPGIIPITYSQGVLLDDDTSKVACNFNEKYHKNNENTPLYTFIEDSVNAGDDDEQIIQDVQIEFLQKNAVSSENHIREIIREIRIKNTE
jgi:hypothetical protein